MSHLLAVKKIIKYVKGTVNFGIVFTKDTNTSLSGYCDADWTGSVDDRRSTSGGCFFMGNNLISWHSKKQNSVSLSTAEAKYIALGSCCTQLMWMRQMSADYGTGAMTDHGNPGRYRRSTYWKIVGNSCLSCRSIHPVKRCHDLRRSKRCEETCTCILRFNDLGNDKLRISG
ncbi:PREDICTED: uncharacterized protein LOC109128704 [Camelina sativa]|uniref:Uncharacterized protein LOC109128704 n=1 Tax=Camelina sativa TaxID=90675 RepID=A0ABM1QWF5_CAMSA|nr:PREDICTED: uncharacterized protein LOC109128704 [Camelina sativa]